jgi:hypothetical protein
LFGPKILTCNSICSNKPLLTIKHGLISNKRCNMRPICFRFLILQTILFEKNAFFIRTITRPNETFLSNMRTVNVRVFIIIFLCSRKRHLKFQMIHKYYSSHHLLSNYDTRSFYSWVINLSLLPQILSKN